MSFTITKNKLKKYLPEGETEIVIPEGVDSIGANVFKDCTEIEAVTLPESLTAIGQRAFSRCTKLKRVIIPESVKTIADYAFFGCENLSSVKLPEQMEKLGDSAFSGCTRLRELVCPKRVDEMGKYVFFNCDGLADADGYVVVDGVLYTYCGEAEVIAVPDTVKCIGDRAFESKVVEITCMGELREVRRVRRILLPESVKRVGENTFAGCVAEDIVSFGIPIESFSSPDLKRLAFIGYAKEAARFEAFPLVDKWNRAYIGTYKKQYLPYIFENDIVEGIKVIAETGKIDPKEFEEVYLRPAQEAHAIQCAAFLIAWSGSRK